MPCPDENQLLGYALGSLAPSTVATLEEHIDACSDCCELLAHFARGTLTEPTATTAPADAGVLAPGGSLGRYIILYPLGAGGMGVVYAAFDPELDRTIAIKVIRPDLRGDVAHAQLRLAREARAAAKLSHPNVVVIFDVGLANDEVFIAMELVTGGALSEWLAAPRSVREIVAMFIQAGRGLAAAHAAGLVHRDFKPQNALVGADGQLRVTDFGLAHLASTTPTPTDGAASEPSITPSLTLTGTVLGTPAYMSPEQHRGEVPGPASDQFSFCVALHEAVYGVRPFAGTSAAELARAIETEALVDPPRPPASARVPTWLRRLLLRGLARDPRARFPSMTAMVAALERGQSTRRRRTITAAVGVAVLVVGGITARTLAMPGAAPVCGDASARLDGVWDVPVRARVAVAFAASSRRFAGPALTTTTASLDQYAASWVLAHHDACEAANVRHEQSADVLDLRMICLDHKLGELRALGALLTHADDHVIEKATVAAQELPPLTECADVERLRLPVREPTDPILRGRIEAVRQQIAEIDQRIDTDQAQHAEPQAAEVVAAANAIGYRPLIAGALDLLGNLQLQLGHAEQATTTLEQAELAAEAAGDIPRAARICSALIASGGVDEPHADAGHSWARRALALLERLDGDPALEATIRHDLSNLFESEGKIDDAKVAADRALALDEQVYGKDDVHVAVVLTDLAGILARQEKLDPSRAALDRALAIKERIYGPWHTEVAGTVGQIAELDSELGRYDDAFREATRALEILEQAYGSEHPAVAFELGSLSDITRSSGKLADAEAYANRALAITEKIDGPDHPHTADILSDLATIAGDRGHFEVAQGLYRRALAIREQALGPDHVDVASSLTELAQSLRDPKLAVPLYERALAIEEKALGKTNPLLAVPLTGIGEAYLGLHDAPRAAAALERAVALRTGQTTKPFDFARIQFDLAQAIVDRDHARAHQLTAGAHEVFLASGFEGHKYADLAEKWLAAHPL